MSDFLNTQKKVAHACQIETESSMLLSGVSLLFTPSQNHCVHLSTTSL